MSLLAIKLDEAGAAVGYTVVSDDATLALQAWPADQYDIVDPATEELRIEYLDDGNGPRVRLSKVRKADA